MFEVEVSHTPDWAAINAAHRIAVQAGIVSLNSLPVGTLGIDEVFSQCTEVNGLPIVAPIHEVPSRTNGFGGRSKTRRASPLLSIDTAPGSASIAEQLSRIGELQSDVELEIDDPKRRFYCTIEETDMNGRVHLSRDPIDDPLQIDTFKTKERVALEIVISALRVEVFENHPRTRGFPSIKRLRANKDELKNVAHLRSKANEESRDLILQAILDDLQQRLKEPPLTDIEKQRRYRYRHIPRWQGKLYSPFFEELQ